MKFIKNKNNELTMAEIKEEIEGVRRNT